MELQDGKGLSVFQSDILTDSVLPAGLLLLTTIAGIALILKTIRRCYPSRKF